MATWQLLSNEVAEKRWDDALLRLRCATPFQTYAWGEYRRALGWRTCHWAAIDNRGEIVAMMLGQVRQYAFKVGLIWCEGGPVGDLSVCGEDLQKAIRETTGLKRVYCRFRCDRPRHIEDALRLTAEGWRRSWTTLTSNYSMQMELTPTESELFARCERNWRRNFRRSEEAGLHIRQWTDPSVDEIHKTYVLMQSAKGIEEQHSREEIEQLLLNLKKHLVIYRCDDEHGELLSLLGWLIHGNRATAVLSATTEKGRAVHASYAIFWAVLQHAKRIGVESCDLAGIDPIRNPGVYRFKRATGATPLEYLGEWDWASAPWLRLLGNQAIARRQRLRNAESLLKTPAAISLAPASNRAANTEALAQQRLAVH
ncbi:MAG TPA: peptidoglycan bridge formation glycyltransferase FemA/FemB family protein [Pyrinomonadaceae bacterium]|nr:peptidoglycan bridge formation glycyltransferase FemA/FemB family protein [Pyrinomonadaceae bacterium]